MARIDDILNDPDFRALPPERQDAFIDEMRQKDFGKIPLSENVLQRAVNIGKQFSQPVQMGENPFMTGAKTALSSMSGNFAPQVSREAQDLRREGVEGLTDNPVAQFGLDVATDPSTYIGGGALGKKVIEKTNPFFSRIGKSIGNVATKKGRLQYFDKMEGAAFGARKKASDKFISGLEEIASKDPNRKVNVSEFAQKAIQSSESDPLIQKAINESPEIMELLTNPTGETSLVQAQNALNSMRSKLPRNVLSGAGKRSKHVPIMDLIDDLSLSMSESFPEISGVRKAYGEVVNSFRAVRPKLSGDAASKNLFANYNPLNPRGKEFMGGERSEEALKNLLKESPELFKEAITTRRVKTAKDLGTAGLGAGATSLFIKKLFGGN